MLEQPQTGLIGRFYRQVENRPKKLKSRFKNVVISSSTYLVFNLMLLHHIVHGKNIQKSTFFVSADIGWFNFKQKIGKIVS